MKLLYTISVFFWILIAFQAICATRTLKEDGFSKSEIVAVTILLLCGLNISRGLIFIGLDDQPTYTGKILLDYFYIGSSVFQILLSSFVLKHIVEKKNKKAEK